MPNRHGLQLSDGLALPKNYVDVNIFHDEHKEKVKSLAQLPVSCYDGAQELLRQADIYKEYGVFPKSLIDGLANKLMSYNDQHLREIANNQDAILDLVNRYFHCG